MARYTGPVCKLCRREGEKLFLKGERCFSPKCAVERRTYPPGEHGRFSGRRSRESDYSLQLRAKQKAKRIYGVLERQFKKHYVEAERRPGLTGENLLQILEMRLDNVVYRLGFADSRRQARQIVQHGHIAVNGRATNIPSCEVKVGDFIFWDEASKKLALFQAMVKDLGSRPVPSWLELDRDAVKGRVIAKPARADIESTIDERLIVEFYSR